MELSSSRKGGVLAPKRVVVFAVCALAVLAVLAVLATAVSGPAYDVRGNTDVPYDAGTVKEVRVLDSFTVYVDGEPKPGASVIGGIALIVLATAAFMTAAALRIAGRRGRLIAFYLLITAGLGYAGLDELFAIHESIGHNLQFLADVPGVERPDDLVLASYLIPVALFAYVFRDVLLSNTTAALALAAGLGFFALSAAGDLAGSRTAEEFMELCSGICIAGGLALLMYSHLHRNLRPEAEVPDEVTVHDQRAPARVPAGVAR
jgi:hypothetical protein